jgi:hypothetical protein
VDFTSRAPLVWRLEGAGLEITADLQRCTGHELGTLDFAEHAALFGARKVILGSGARVESAEGLASVVSGGPTRVEQRAKLGNLYSVGDVLAGTRAIFDGAVVTEGNVRGRTAIFRGTVEERSFVHRHSLDWEVDFRLAHTDVVVRRHEQQSRGTGNYDDVTVGSFGRLRLSTGTYYFDSLELDPGAELVLDDALGPVIVYVRERLKFQGGVRSLSGLHPNLLLGYFASAPTELGGAFRGLLIAPEANVTVLAGLEHQGAIFADGVELDANARLRFVER